MSFSKVFGGFSMKNFARVMGLLFGSTGANTYPKSGQVAPSPPSASRNLLQVSLRDLLQVSLRDWVIM